MLTLAAIALFAPRGPILAATVLLGLGMFLVLLGFGSGPGRVPRGCALRLAPTSSSPLYTAYYVS